jgi:hypothetical protein
MKKILLIVVLLTIMAGGAYQYMRINTYSYHLHKAEAALTRIDELLQGKSPTSFIPTAHAQNGGVDEAAIARNADTAVNEIGMAQDIVDKISDEANRSSAQKDVNDTKDHAESTLEAAHEAVEGAGPKKEITDALDTLDDIKPGEGDSSDATANIDDPNYDPNEDPNMRADGSSEDDEEDDGDEDDEDEIGDEKPIDEAQVDGDKDDEANSDTNDADYEAAEAAATERYQPYLDWTGDTPVPLENEKQLEKDTALTPTIDPELMQEAIEKLMEQQ